MVHAAAEQAHGELARTPKSVPLQILSSRWRNATKAFPHTHPIPTMVLFMCLLQSSCRSTSAHRSFKTWRCSNNFIWFWIYKSCTWFKRCKRSRFNDQLGDGGLINWICACCPSAQQEPMGFDGAWVAWFCWIGCSCWVRFHVWQWSRVETVATNGSQCAFVSWFSHQGYYTTSIQPWKQLGWKCNWQDQATCRNFDSLLERAGGCWVFYQQSLVELGFQTCVLVD